jgi:hypothetical protein
MFWGVVFRRVECNRQRFGILLLFYSKNPFYQAETKETVNC